MDRSLFSDDEKESVDSELADSFQVDSSHFSLNVMSTIRWNLLQDVYSCKDTGINTVGLWRNKLDRFGVEKGIELVKEENLQVSSLSWAGGFTGSHGLSFIEAVDDGIEAINIAHALNCNTLIVVSGALGAHIESHARKTVSGGLKWMADFAAEKNVTLALLPMHESFRKKWTFLNHLDDCLDMINSCDHPNVRMAFNTYHMGCERNILNRIASIVKYIQIVQIADCRTVPSVENDRCMPGEGILPVSSMVNELIENGYQDYFEFDIWSKELWNSDYSELITDCQARFMDLITTKVEEVSGVYL